MEEIVLPFEGAAAQAILVRRKDGAILGALYHGDKRYLLPTGQILAGETPVEALSRVLSQLKLQLIDPDVNWDSYLAVNYLPRKNQLGISFVLLVEEVRFGENEALADVRWLDQTQDVWHEQMRENILLAIKAYIPDLLNVEVSVLESW